MKRIYVAGSYACAGRCEPIGVDLISMRAGIEACLKVLYHGMAPFCPWLDYLFVLMDRQRCLPEKWYYDYSIAFLEVCDAMWVINQRGNGYGVAKEIEIAEGMGIPIFYRFEDLGDWNARCIRRMMG